MALFYEKPWMNISVGGWRGEEETERGTKFKERNPMISASLQKEAGITERMSWDDKSDRETRGEGEAGEIQGGRRRKRERKTGREARRGREKE